MVNVTFINLPSLLIMQWFVSLVLFDWLEAIWKVKDVWRFVSMRHGEQSVMIFGKQMMHQLLVELWVTPDSVSFTLLSDNNSWYNDTDDGYVLL